MDNVLLAWSLTSGFGLLFTVIFLGVIDYGGAETEASIAAHLHGPSSVEHQHAREVASAARGRLVIGLVLSILAPVGVLAVLVALASLVPAALRWIGGGFADAWRLVSGGPACSLPRAQLIKEEDRV